MAINSVTYANGSALVPQPVANDLIRAVRETSAALRLFRIQNMSSNTLRMPVQTSIPTAYWVAEGGVKQTTNLTYGNQFLQAEEIAVIVPVADNLIADADFDLWSEIRASLVSAFAQRIDSTVIFGQDRPASFSPSLVEGSLAAGNVVDLGTNANGADGGVTQDILDTMRLVSEDGYPINGFVASDLFNYSLLGARDANGNPLLGANASIDTLYGRNVAYVGGNLFANGEGDAQLIAGDFKNAVIGLRQDISYYTSKDATVGGVSMFETDQTAIRATMRLGFSVVSPLTNAGAGAYPFSILRNAPGV